jgi:hypothetical protein
VYLVRPRRFIVDKREILSEIRFGHRVAEEELDQLSRYFVETDQWNRVLSGEIDIIYGPKGSGKSAIYGLLNSRRNELFDRNVLLAAAENPQGALAFNGVVADPPTSEEEFRALWKLYLLSLVSKVIDDYDIDQQNAQSLRRILANEGLVPHGKDLAGILSGVLYYARRALRPEALQAGVEIDQVTGLPKGFSGKITFREPAPPAREQGFHSIDSLLRLAESALQESGYAVWLLLDRLDVAFAESPALELNALRALFRVYLDLSAYEHIRLKIFLRSDIWQRITTSGFREASHITKDMTITWDESSLLNLIIRRAIQNRLIQEVLASTASQREFFYRVFPNQVDVGEKKPSTFDWILSRTRDASGYVAPREVIHLLNELREVQIRRLEEGQTEPGEEALFVRPAFKDALVEVSRARVEQTLFAEHPHFRDHLLKLKGEKTSQFPTSLAKIWDTSSEKARQIAEELNKIAFFEIRGSKDELEYWVPFLFRDGLDLVQGSAED